MGVVTPLPTILPATRRLKALQAAREWVGCYEGMNGATLESGDATDAPADMLDAMVVLDQEIRSLQEFIALQIITRTLQTTRGMLRTSAAQAARKMIKDDPTLIATALRAGGAS